METGQLDEVLQIELRGEIRRRDGHTAVLVAVEEIPDHRLATGLLELVASGEADSVGIEENAVETLLDKGPEDACPILSVDPVKLGRRMDEGAQRVEGRRLRQDELLDFERQVLQQWGCCGGASSLGCFRLRCRRAVDVIHCCWGVAWHLVFQVLKETGEN